MNSNTLKVSIVTVNYHSEKDILNSLISIVEKTEKIEFEYIIVSNSPLKSDFKESVLKIYDQVIFHQMTDNVGFATACNKGGDLSSGDLLFFLNPDTEFINDVLFNLIKCFGHSESIGIVGPKTLTSDGALFPSAKNNLSASYFFSIILPFFYRDKPDKRYGHFFPDSTTTVPALNGHALLISKKLFATLDGMDENFFMYWEENDLCYRASEIGFSSFYCDQSVLTHHSGTSTNSLFSKMEIEKHRSQKKFVLKHYPEFYDLNRISGILGYFSRTLISLVLLRKAKTKQFFSLWIWYCFSYR